METGVTDLSVKNPQIIEILDVREVKKSIFEVEFAHVFPFLKNFHQKKQIFDFEVFMCYVFV